MASLPHGWHHNIDPQPTLKKSSLPQKSPRMSLTSRPGLKKKIPVRISNGVANGVANNNSNPQCETVDAPISNGTEPENNGHPPPATTTGSTLPSKPRARWNLPPSAPVLKSTESMQVELASLKKELVTLRDENIALKTRLKRMTDDNTKKAKQIEKLLLAGQEESMNNEKKKAAASSDCIPALRQKCSRLENALKEKEATIKKLQSEKMAKMQETKSTIDGYQKEITTLKNQLNRLSSNGQKSNSTQLQRSRMGPSAQPSNKASGAENSIEVTRLRDTLHRLQQDNQRMSQQLKEKNIELKQVKVQLQKSNSSQQTAPRISSMHLPQSSGAQSTAANRAKSKTPPTSVNKAEAIRKPTTLPVKQTNLTARVRMQEINSKALKKPLTTASSIKKVSSAQPPLKATFVVKKQQQQQKEQQQKELQQQQQQLQEQLQQQLQEQLQQQLQQQLQEQLQQEQQQQQLEREQEEQQQLEKEKAEAAELDETLQAAVAASIALATGDTTPDIIVDDDTARLSQLQEIRDNIAAKKIQRSWRNHREKLQSLVVNGEDEALLLLQSALRGHSQRAEQLELLSEDCLPAEDGDDELENAAEALQKITNE